MSTEINSIENKQSEVGEISTSEIAERVQQIMTREDVTVVVIYKNNQPDEKISAQDLVENIEELVEGKKLRRIVVTKANGETLLDVSLRTGVVMAVLSIFLFPKVFGLGVVGALLARVKAEVVSPNIKTVEIETNKAE